MILAAVWQAESARKCYSKETTWFRKFRFFQNYNIEYFYQNLTQQLSAWRAPFNNEIMNLGPCFEIENVWSGKKKILVSSTAVLNFKFYLDYYQFTSLFESTICSLPLVECHGKKLPLLFTSVVILRLSICQNLPKLWQNSKYQFIFFSKQTASLFLKTSQPTDLQCRMSFRYLQYFLRVRTLTGRKIPKLFFPNLDLVFEITLILQIYTLSYPPALLQSNIKQIKHRCWSLRPTVGLCIGQWGGRINDKKSDKTR